MTKQNFQSDFKSATISGIKWSVVGRIGHNIIVFIIGIILARLLSPTEYGLLGMITVIIGFARIFTELGFGAALIQKKEITNEELSSVFWLNFLGGILLTILIILSAPAIAAFFQTPKLKIITIFISFNFLISSLAIVHNTLLTKEINFKYISYAEISSTIVAGGIAIGMAYKGWGVWSLVAQSLIGSLIIVVLMWYLSPWKPSFFFSFKSIKGLLNFSLNHLGNRSLNYWARNLDNLLIGKYLGSDPLGIYSKSYSIMLLPLQNVSNVLSRVMFPALSKIQEDKAKVRRIFLKMTRGIALISFPMMLGLLIVVKPFVIVILGEQWSDMIPILRILCLLGMAQSIGTLNGNLYLSQGRTDLQFRVGIFLKINVFVGIILGLNWGVVGVAAGYAVASFINSYPSFKFAGKLVNITYWELIKNLKSVFLVTIIMAAIVWILGWLVSSLWPMWLLLLVQVLVGIMSYVVLIHIFNIRSYLELSDFVKNILGKG